MLRKNSEKSIACEESPSEGGDSLSEGLGALRATTAPHLEIVKPEDDLNLDSLRIDPALHEGVAAKVPLTIQVRKPPKQEFIRVRPELGRVDGFDDDEAQSECDEGSEVLVRFLATERNALEALELADKVFEAGAGAIERLREEGRPVLGR
jgi:hypothetical protein